MIEPTPALVVFGLDADDNPRAGRFAEPDVQVAVSAAAFLGYHVLHLGDAELLDALPDGNIFVRGSGFTQRISRTVFEKLVTAAAPQKTALTSGKPDSAARIRGLNDQLRRFGRGGRVMMTSGIEVLGAAAIARIMIELAAFDAFTADNDPYGEHDCATLDVDSIRVLFKIDYYDRDLTYHSPDPSDPSVTQRVMTVMRADEY